MAGCGSCLSLCLVRAQRPVSLIIDSHTGVTNVHRWNWTNVGSPTLSVLVLKYGEGTLKICLRAPRGVALRSVGTESWREAENETCPHVLPRAVVLFFVHDFSRERSSTSWFREQSCFTLISRASQACSSDLRRIHRRSTTIVVLSESLLQY